MSNKNLLNNHQKAAIERLCLDVEKLCDQHIKTLDDLEKAVTKHLKFLAAYKKIGDDDQ